MKKIIRVHSLLKLCRKIVITCKSVSKQLRTFLTVITQITIFSLNLGTFNNNFKTATFFMGRSFQ